MISKWSTYNSGQSVSSFVDCGRSNPFVFLSREGSWIVGAGYIQVTPHFLIDRGAERKVEGRDGRESKRGSVGWGEAVASCRRACAGAAAETRLQHSSHYAGTACHFTSLSLSLSLSLFLSSVTPRRLPTIWRRRRRRAGSDWGTQWDAGRMERGRHDFRKTS